MNIIVAVDKNWAIGLKNKLLVTIPADHKMFRQETMGKVVVYGRKTLETFPGKKPLQGRTNIVLTTDEAYAVKDALTVHSLKELFRQLEQYDTKDVYVIGGESVYRQLLPFCDTAHVTKIEHQYEADAWFPDLDADGRWRVTADSEEQTYFDLEYKFLKYEKIEKRG